MQKQILTELKELKTIMARLIGTSDLPHAEQFSPEALNKAAKGFKKMSIERGEWLKEDDIGKCIKGEPWRAGKFIRTEFGFYNFFKWGRIYYYYKKDLLALGKELKERNVDLKRYMELKEDQANFEKKVTVLSLGKKTKHKNASYQLPAGLRDITTSSPPLPSAEIVKENLNQLKEEFFKNKLAEYIDIYRGNYAMQKYVYHFEKYIDPQLRKKCRKWCENFNYANHALELITKKKDVFIPVPEEEMIQL